MPGQRQGNPQLGFDICPHTCGCIITQSIVNKSRKKPDWFKWAPLALKDRRHILKHNKSTSIHPNCDNTCSMLDAEGRDLTHEEWTAWAPHLSILPVYPGGRVWEHFFLPIDLSQKNSHGCGGVMGSHDKVCWLSKAAEHLKLRSAIFFLISYLN